jgi:hypothetical protein
MSVVPEIERQLRDAAIRRAQTPFARLRARTRHLRALLGARPPLIALAALLGIAGAALAAGTLVGVGKPAPREYPRLDQVILPQGTRLLSLHVSDPAGGPPWGMRLILTAQAKRATHAEARSRSADVAHWGCVQIGRIVDGKLGVLGEDGAFHDDGLFHELPAQPEACGAVARDGALAGLTGGSNIETASAYQGLEGCVSEPVRHQQSAALPSIERELAIARSEGDAQGVRGALENLADYRRVDPRIQAEPTCPTADLRRIFFGVAGPRATSVSVSGRGIHETIAVSPADDGAYVIVQRVSARERMLEALRSENLVLWGLAMHATVHYENGRSCPEESSPSCLAPLGSLRVGRAPAAGAAQASRTTQASTTPRAAPATALSRRAEADPATPNPVTVSPASGGARTRFKLSFHALLSGGGYSYRIEAAGPRRCQRVAELAIDGGAIMLARTPIVRGQQVSKTLDTERHPLCPGRYRVYVAFADLRPDALPSFPFATVHFTVAG